MTQEPTARRRGRPRTPVLTKRKITDAAVALIASGGYRCLTMASLAAQLGVSASALYNHVGSKREIMILLQDRVNQDIDRSAFETEPWDVALERWARSYREVYARNIPLIPVMSVMPVADSPHTLRMYETVAAALVRAGWPESSAVNTIVAVESLVFGSAYDAVAPADIFDPGELSELAPVFTDAVAHREVTAGAHPGRDDAPGAGAPSPAETAFDVALRAMLDGLRLRLAALHMTD